MEQEILLTIVSLTPLTLRHISTRTVLSATTTIKLMLRIAGSVILQYPCQISIRSWPLSRQSGMIGLQIWSRIIPVSLPPNQLRMLLTTSKSTGYVLTPWNMFKSPSGPTTMMLQVSTVSEKSLTGIQHTHVLIRTISTVFWITQCKLLLMAVVLDTWLTNQLLSTALCFRVFQWKHQRPVQHDWLCSCRLCWPNSAGELHRKPWQSTIRIVCQNFMLCCSIPS